MTGEKFWATLAAIEDWHTKTERQFPLHAILLLRLTAVAATLSAAQAKKPAEAGGRPQAFAGQIRKAIRRATIS